jgi:hypothetical protein
MFHMKLSDLATELPHMIRCGHAVHIKSPPGRGKSTFMDNMIEELSAQDGEKWGHSDLFLATQTPPDLIGFQFKGEVVFDGKTYSITDPTLPTWFITKDGLPCFAYKRGVVVLDEFGKGATDTKSAAAELLLNKRIGKFYLPDEWACVALSNLMTDRSGETKELDFIINRTSTIWLSDDLRGTVDWWLAHGASRQMLAFIESTHDGKTGAPIVFEGAPDKQGPWMTPRSGFMCDQYLRRKAAAQGTPDQLPYDAHTVECVQGYIGVPAATALFQALVIDREQPPFEDIVKDPLGVRVPDRADAMMMVCYNLASKVDEKHLKAVIQYISRFDADFAVTFTRAMLKRRPQFASNASFLEWAMKNGTLIAQISALNSLVK